MIKAVLDPNVLISAFLSRSDSAPSRIVREWRNGGFELLASPLLISELVRVMKRPKFAKQAGSGRAEAYVAVISAGAVLLNDPIDRPQISRDPADDYLLALARAGGADFLVSGDGDLLEIAAFNPPVISPREFVDRLRRTV